MSAKKLIVFFCLPLLLVACRSSLRVPDLGSLYNRIASEHDEHRNPVIVIPGILGSRLIQPENGAVVWGAFDRSSLDPEKPEGARAMALPMGEGLALAELRDEVVPSGVLETFRLSLIGLPLELEAYAHILLTLGIGGYRDATLNDGIDYGEDHFTCFQFDYDWRRSNVENAQRFKRFLEERRAEVSAGIEARYGNKDPDVRFDVIAHSMGGLMLRYFLRYGDEALPEGQIPPPTWAGAQYVDRAVLVASPNAGAVDVMRYLIHGRSFGPFTATYAASLLGSYPSMYELLPRARHNPVVDSRDEPLDILDPEVWIREGWGLADRREDEVLAVLMPGVHSAEERRRIALDHLRKNLQNAGRFHAALDAPSTPPEGLSLHLFAGDAKLTAKRARWDGRRYQTLEEDWGDGDVLRSSALMDERLDGRWQPTLRSPIHWQNVTFHFTDHLGITQDPSFTDNLLYLLLEAPRLPTSNR